MLLLRIKCVRIFIVAAHAGEQDLGDMNGRVLGDVLLLLQSKAGRKHHVPAFQLPQCQVLDQT